MFTANLVYSSIPNLKIKKLFSGFNKYTCTFMIPVNKKIKKLMVHWGVLVLLSVSCNYAQLLTMDVGVCFSCETILLERMPSKLLKKQECIGCSQKFAVIQRTW